jgi:hypothetical protein
MDVDARIRYTNISKKSILLRQIFLCYLSSHSLKGWVKRIMKWLQKGKVTMAWHGMAWHGIE